MGADISGVWRDRAAFTWDYRTFNFRKAIFKAASDLLPVTPVRKVTLIAPSPTIERPYPDLSFVQAHISFETDKLGATAMLTIIRTDEGYKLWTINTAIESLLGYPEVPERDGHMTGPHSWHAQREMDVESVQPEVLIIGAGQKCVSTLFGSGKTYIQWSDDSRSVEGTWRVVLGHRTQPTRR